MQEDFFFQTVAFIYTRTTVHSDLWCTVAVQVQFTTCTTYLYSVVQTAVSSSSVSFFTVFLLSVNLLLGVKFIVLFVLLFKTIELGLYPLDVATEVRLPRPSNTCWPTKYEILTTAVRKLLTSVPFRWGRCSLERPCQGPPTHHIRTTCNHPLEIGD
jgi:hypothetical protein